MKRMLVLLFFATALHAADDPYAAPRLYDECADAAS